MMGGLLPRLAGYWRNVISEDVSAQSLAVFRLAFGALMVWDIHRYAKNQWIELKYVSPDFLFRYELFHWLPVLDDPHIHWAWAFAGLCAGLIMVGLFYRLAIISFILVFGYFFLLDKAQYLNHFYLVLIYAFVFAWLPAERRFSLDALIWPHLRGKTVPGYSVWALRTQTEIVLLYAGFVKLTEDWFYLQPLASWLRKRSDDLIYGELVYQDWFVAIGAYGSIALHLIGAPLLLWKRTRLGVFVVYVTFHLSNAYVFSIGVFPWLTIAATTIFFAPHWPQQLWNKLRRSGSAAIPVTVDTVRGGWDRAWLKPVIVTSLSIWLIAQVLVPLRLYTIPSEAKWTGEGHRFAWRMKLLDRRTDGNFIVRCKDTGQEWVIEPDDYLFGKQKRKMMPRPDMIIQFAHHLKDQWAWDDYTNVAVYADIKKSLNGRAYQQFTDPTVDLLQYDRNALIKPIDFIIPLNVDIRERDETSGRAYAGAWSSKREMSEER